MATILKRKGGPTEVNDNTPKRIKSSVKVVEQTTTESPTAARNTAHIRHPIETSTTDLSKDGWDAGFVGLKNGTELVKINGIKDKDDLEASVVENLKENILSSQATPFEPALGSRTSWRIADSVGGRIVTVDPVFVGEEKYFVVAQKRTLLVYSATNSLLNRSIKLALPDGSASDARIVALSLSTTDAHLIWIAYSTGLIYCVDWTNGTGSQDFWTLPSQAITDLATVSLEYAKTSHNIIYTTDKREDGDWRIQAHELLADGVSVARTIYTSSEEIQSVNVSEDGAVILATSGSRLLLGYLKTKDFVTLEKVKYLFRIFESSDYISSVDLRASQREVTKGTKQSPAVIPVVDVVVGDVRGSIFVHNDLLGNLILAETQKADGQKSISLMPRKLHWHQKCVDSVKWSRDGNYIISGGSENVMVQWQLDTGRHGFLPNLTARIQNIVISPLGSSYAVNLADNSTMVLSTSELEPTAHISGLQAHVIKSRDTPDAQVRRVFDERTRKPIVERVPALICPNNPAHLLLAVGDTQELDPQHALRSAVPYLQTYDISASHNVSKQSFTRTNIVTAKQFAPSAHKIDEPRITHMQTSHNGKWLATVDEWLPPKRDVDFLKYCGGQLSEEQRRRREVFLKFWKWNAEGENWELVSRIDAPHTISSLSSGAGQVLSLTSDPVSLSFATLGEDGIARIWKPRTRKRDNVVVKAKGGDVLVDWRCQHSIPLGKPDLADVTVEEYLYERPEHGSLSYSEDGSLLAAGLSTADDGLIHLLDTSSGTVRSSRPGLYRGPLIALAFLAHNLITLADDLEVHDLVSETLKYGITLGKKRTNMTIEQKAHMMHLTVDPLSLTFAVALPTTATSANYLSASRSAKKSFNTASTEIGVFSMDNAIPLISHTLDTFATALVPAIGTPGYIVLDASAEITPIIPRSVQSLTSIAQPLANQQLDLNEDEVAERGLADIIEDAAEADEDADDEMVAILDTDVDMDVNVEDVEDEGPRVVSQQALRALFDNGPAFTMPPMEEMFHQVCELFSSKAMGI